MLTRRAMIALTGLVALSAHTALAHEGHDLSRIEVATLSCQHAADGLVLTLSISNGRDTEIRLEAGYCDLGAVTVARVTLAPASALDTEIVLHATDIPGIFTVVLDFGPAGYGPVTVIPI